MDPRATDWLNFLRNSLLLQEQRIYQRIYQRIFLCDSEERRTILNKSHADIDLDGVTRQLAQKQQ
ncbi:MAG: hypothetical protein DMG64_18215 [Acidobacteria bacterium]|nr:MAG: hypothetical protein DMG64_18215 [Acidobacteriota bacterium]PYY02069.1 MAG: hypothetical protein DMG63_01665 [Acidobacteriota bacterium]